LQRAIGNAQVSQAVAARRGNASPVGVIRRQEAPGATAIPASETVTFEGPLGPVQLGTNAQLAGIGRFIIADFQEALTKTGLNDSLRQRIEDWIAWTQAELPSLNENGDQLISPQLATLARSHLKTAGEIARDIAAAREQEKRAAALLELRAAQAEADAIAAEAERMRPALDRQLRAAFRTGDEGIIREWADRIGTVTDIGLGIQELSRQIAEEGLRLDLPAVSKLTQALNYLNKGLAALNLFFTYTDRQKRATELEQGMRQINDAAGAFSALGTLLGAAPHIGLYANLWLVPLTKAITAQMSRLTNQLHNLNEDWVELTGEFMYPAAEPGGEDMFRFMIAVMRADTADAMPEMPPSVKGFLVDQREALGAGAKKDIPTTGWWFWRELETKQARSWIFANRRVVWAMLYGSMKVPEPKANP
jgi:hypothetical protein